MAKKSSNSSSSTTTEEVTTSPVYTLTETVNINDVLEIFRDQSLELDQRTFNILIDFIHNNGNLTVNYHPSPDSPDGNLYCDHGLQWVSEKECGVRSRLCKDLYDDIDFNNNHPRILHTLCKEKGIDNEDMMILKDYIDNREVYLERTGFTKKRILIQINDPTKELPKDPFANKLLKSISNLALSLGNNGSEISKVLNARQRILLDQLINHMKSENIDIVSLVFDGLIVKKSLKISEAIGNWNYKNPSHPILLKPWKKTESKLVDLQRFDFNDPCVFSDLSRLQGTIYPSFNSLLKTVLPTLLKTVRTTNWSVFITKNTKRNINCTKKLEYTFQYKNEPRIMSTSIRALMETIPQLFVFDSITYFEPNPYEFSLFPGFLPDMNLVLPNYEEHISPILNHIKDVWCAGDLYLYEFVLDYFAQIVQVIPCRTETILLLTGDEGTGKSCIFEFIERRVFGTLSLCLTGCDKLTRNFNAHLAGKILICLEELKGESDTSYKHDLNRIKQIITATKIDIEKKGIDVTTDDNGVNLIGFSNFENPLPPIPGMNRRIVTSKTSNARKNDGEYFTNLITFLQNDVHLPACFLHFLKIRQVDQHRLKFCKPETQTKYEAQWTYLPYIEKTLYYIALKGLPTTVSSKEFLDILPTSLYNKDKPTLTYIGKKLREYSSNVKHINGIRSYELDPTKYQINENLINVLKDVLLDVGDNLENAPCYLDDQLLA